MIKKFLPLLALFMLICAPVWAQEANHTTVQLIAERPVIKPGDTIRIGIKQTIDPHWHTYWKNPGDSGEATSVHWTLPDGFTVGDIQWPVPQKLPFGPLMNFGYEDQAMLFQTLSVPENLTPGQTITLEAVVDRLVCKDICIPESSTHRLDLVTASPEDPVDFVDRRITDALRFLPQEKEILAFYDEDDGHFIVEVHLTENIRAALQDNRDVVFYPEEWGMIDNPAPPRTHFTQNSGIPRLLYAQKRGNRTFSDLDSEKLTGVLAYEDGQGFALSLSRDPNLSMRDFPGIAAGSSVLPGSDVGFLMAVFLAILGGLILNLMPCVFPVLSIKTMALVNMADKNLSQARMSGIFYTLGILASFALIALVLIALRSAGEEIGWGFQLQNPGVIAFLAMLLFVIGLNLSGFFDLTLGRLGGAGSSLAQKGGATGSFFTGVLATLVATPCTAPFMGVAMGYAMTQPPVASLSVFLALGFGLALPYLLLSFVPRLRRALPKPGTWMIVFRQALAFPMYAAAVWLVWVLAIQADAGAVFAILFGMVMVALAIWLWQHLPQRATPRLIVHGLAILSLLAAAFPWFGGLYAAMDGQSVQAQSTDLSFIPFSTQALDRQLAGNDPVFVNMTAAWCITCKANERVALEITRTRNLFEQHDVRYLKGDWTNRDPEITKFLESYGRNGVPIYVFYGQRDLQTGQRPEPRILPQILTPGTISGLF